MSVNTKQVTGRRTLKFNSLDDILADAEKLAAGPIRVLGNWSPGQIFQHLAITMNGAIDGMPLKASLLLRMFGWLFKNKILTGTMPAGIQLPADSAKHLVPPETTLDAGLQSLRAATQRMKTESHRAKSPFLGALTREQYDQLQCRHAELHLSFLVPE